MFAVSKSSTPLQRTNAGDLSSRESNCAEERRRPAICDTIFPSIRCRRDKILLAEKSLQPPITTLGNMMGNFRTYDSCNSYHKEKIAEKDRFVKFYILSPELVPRTPDSRLLSQQQYYFF
jgi:hypothetical protein